MIQSRRIAHIRRWTTGHDEDDGVLDNGVVRDGSSDVEQAALARNPVEELDGHVAVDSSRIIR
jgi:hypothetical protein